jgi:hypothetical protein
MKKSFYDISWKVSEEEYRADPALSYSTIAKYERSGFNELDHLFDKIETPSLTFGSAVDSIITGGEQEFKDRFIVAEFPAIPDSIITIVKQLFSLYNESYRTLESIPDDNILSVIVSFNYQSNWRPETRVKVVKEKGSQYYRLLYLSKDKIILNTSTYKDVLNAVEALKTSDSTKWYFQEDNPFDDIERKYQLKFKATLYGIDYRCMADELIIDHKNKTVQPIDLKTSGKKEWDFYKSFVEWRYDLQAKLYWQIIRKIMNEDWYFSDFKLLPYRFIVVNRNSLTPLVWEFDNNRAKSTLTLDGKTIIIRDPTDIGGELTYLLNNKPKVPIGIDLNGVNNLNTWLNRL